MASGVPFKSSPSPRSSSPQHVHCKLCEGKDETISKLNVKLEQMELSFKTVMAAIKKYRGELEEQEKMLKEKDHIINDLIAAGSSGKSADGFKTDDHKRISELEASICELSTICGEYKTQRLKDKSTIDQLHEKIKVLTSNVQTVKGDPCQKEEEEEEDSSKARDESKNCPSSSFTSSSFSLPFSSSSSSSSSSASLKLLRNRNTQTDEMPLGTCRHCKIVTVDASTQFSSSSFSPLNVSNAVTSESVIATLHSTHSSPREGVNCHQLHDVSSLESKSKKVTPATVVISTANEEIESENCHITSGNSERKKCISYADVDVNDDVFTQTSCPSSTSPMLSLAKSSASLSNLNETCKLSKSHSNTGSGESESKSKLSSVVDEDGEDEDKRPRASLADASSAQLAIGIPSGSNTSSVTTRILASIATSASSSSSPSSSAQHQVSIGSVHSSSIQQQQQQQHHQQRLEHPSGAASLGASSGVSLFYVNELARKEIELAEARLAAREYECALRELQWQSSVEKFRLKAKVTEYEKVRAQLTQLTAAASSTSSMLHNSSCAFTSSGYGFGKNSSFTSSSSNTANILYVKNVLQNFIKTKDKKQQKIMLNALLTALDMEERV